MSSPEEAVKNFCDALHEAASYHGSYVYWYDPLARELYEKMEEAENAMLPFIEDEGRVQNAICRYFEAKDNASKCTDLLLADPLDSRPAELMTELEEAREAMYKAAGIEK